jgi:hypothetical protein
VAQADARGTGVDRRHAVGADVTGRLRLGAPTFGAEAAQLLLVEIVELRAIALGVVHRVTAQKMRSHNGAAIRSP